MTDPGHHCSSQATQPSGTHRGQGLPPPGPSAQVGALALAAEQGPRPHPVTEAILRPLAGPGVYLPRGVAAGLFPSHGRGVGGGLDVFATHRASDLVRSS
jgi:hypothetical protein